jgi:2-isopropylmalate synthase
MSKTSFLVLQEFFMLEIYDCTLREGEQAGGVSFEVRDRIEIAKVLHDFGMDFIELGWPVQKEAMDAFLELQKTEIFSKIVAFGSTSISANVREDINLKSIIDSKAKYACIFGKTWAEHVEKQLKISKEENLRKIEESLRFLKEKGIDVFYDAEHYFDGFKDNPDYSLKTLEAAAKGGASRIILCDTNGGVLPEEVSEIIKITKDFFKSKNLHVKLGVHMHNDSGLALTNSLESLKYVEHFQGTINGLGERVGNLDLCEFVPLLMLKKKIALEFKLDKIKPVCDLVYKIANVPRKINQAFVSQRAFSHKGGVHIDATMKGAVYEHVSPGIFGMNHDLILTSLGGSSCVTSAAKKFGFELDKKDLETKEKISRVLNHLNMMEKRGYDSGNIEAEQFMLIETYFGRFQEYFNIEKWKITTDNERSVCEIKLLIGNFVAELVEEVNGGPIDAAYNCLKKLIMKMYPQVSEIKLEDYRVRIARSDGVKSQVRTRINFSDGFSFSTVGVSSNIIESGLESLQKAFNYYLNVKKTTLKT